MNSRSLLSVAVCLALAAPAWAQARKISTDISPAARASYQRAQRAIAAKDLATAERELDGVVAAAPDFPKAFHLYLYAFAGRPDAKRALAEKYRALARANPDRSIYWFAVGRLADDGAEREAAFSKVVALEPNAPWGYWGLGAVRRAQERPADAVALYEKANALAGGDAAVGAGLVSAYLAAGRRADALKLLDALVAKAPGDLDVDYAYMAVLNATPPPELSALLDRYVAAFPEGVGVDVAYTVKVGALAGRDRAAAAALAREALAKLVGPRFAEVRAALFESALVPAALAAGPPAVEKLAADTLAANEPAPGAYLAVARALGDPAKAIPLLRKGYDLFLAAPGAPAALGNALRLDLGRAYLATGDAARGAELLEAVTVGDQYLAAQRDLAGAYAKAGSAPKAYAALARIVARDPSAANVAALAAAAKVAGRSDADAAADVWTVRDALAKPAPAFTLDGLDGKPVSLAAYRGKVLLLSFWFPS